MQPKLISSKKSRNYQTINVSSRPTRIGFVINREIDYETMRKVIQYNSSIWGGEFNAFVPIDGISIREDWMYLLVCHDPDILIFVGEVTGTLIDDLYRNLQPMQIFRWEDSILDSLSGRPSRINPILAISLMDDFHRFNPLFNTENSLARLPIIGDSIFQKCLEINFGLYSELTQYSEVFTEYLAATEVQCTPDNLASYFNLLDVMAEKITPLAFTSIELRLKFHGFPAFYSSTVILTDNSVDDLFLFHFLRTRERSKLQSIVTTILPLEGIKESDFETLAKWLRKKLGSRRLCLASFSVPLDKLQVFRNLLKNELNKIDSEWKIEIRRCNFDMEMPHVTHEERQELISIEDRQFSITPHPIRFSKSVGRNQSWVTEVELSPKFGNRRGFIPSMFYDLNLLLSGYEDRSILLSLGARLRIARGSLAFPTTKELHFMMITLPSETKLIDTALQNMGIAVVNNKTTYYKGIVDILGNLEDLHIFRQPYLFDMFCDSKFIRGRTYTVREFEKKFHLAQDARDKTLDLLQDLSRKSVLLRGYTLECPTCGLDEWYAMHEISEIVICHGCQSAFQLPVYHDFSYKLNTLLADRNNHGTICTLLTLGLLYATSRHSMLWQADIEIEYEKTRCEVDIIAMCDGYLTFAECKNSFRLDRTDKLIDQLSSEITLARQAKAHLFIFATLQEQIPTELLDFLKQENDRDDHLSVRMVTKDDLLRGRLLEEERNAWFIQQFVKPLPIYRGDDCVDVENSANAGY